MLKSYSLLSINYEVILRGIGLHGFLSNHFDGAF